MSKLPKELYALQSWMGELLKRPLREVDRFKIPIYDPKTVREARRRIKPGPKLKAEQCIGLYNQQVWYRFMNLLQEDYPLLVRLFGPRDFNRLIAEPYLLAHWPDHWSLALLGRRLPGWLKKNYREEDRRLILSSAQIDEAHSRLFFEPILAPMGEGDLEKKLYLQPRVALFELEADLFLFRKALLELKPEEWFEKPFPSIQWGRKRPFVLWFEPTRVCYEELTKAAYLLLRELQRGATLAEVCSCLSERDLLIQKEAEQGIANWFQQWSQRGWLTAHKSF